MRGVMWVVSLYGDKGMTIQYWWVGGSWTLYYPSLDNIYFYKCHKIAIFMKNICIWEYKIWAVQGWICLWAQGGWYFVNTWRGVVIFFKSRS